MQLNKIVFAKIAKFLVFMFVVTGCASQNRLAQPEIRTITVKKIAILPVKEPRALTLGKRGGPLVFLPGGRAWSVLEMAGKSSQFARGIRTRNLTLGRDITNALRDNLEKHGWVTEAGAFSLFSSLVYRPQLNLKVVRQ